MGWNYIVTEPEFTGDKEAKIIRKPKTNADKLRAMSDEELASKIDCPYGEDWETCKNASCWSCKFDWLNKECE